MTATVLDATTRAATVAATTQDAQRAAQWAPFGVGDVTVRHMAGAVIAEVSTHGSAILNSLTPLGATLGALSASTVNVSGATITSHVFVTAGGTAIFSVPTTDATLSAPATLTGRRINLAALLLNANSALPLAPTYLLTFTADDAATVSVAAAGSIVNTGTGACAWSITPPSGVAVSPSSGTLAAGATQALTVTASAAATYSLTLVSSGATITNATQSIVVSLAPPTTATLSGSTAATATVAETYTVTLNAVADQTYTITPSASDSGAISPTTRTITAGNTTGTFTVTWPVAGAARSVDFTISPTLSRAGRPIGVTVAAAAIPTWVPAAGDAVQLTLAAGTMANVYTDSCAPYYGKYWHPNTLNAYSGGVYNPHHGTYGAYVCFGSGHAGTNDNSVLALEIGSSACTWRRLTDPTPFAGAGTDTTTQGNNSVGHYGSQIDWDWGENAGIDSQPCSDHSYGSLTIVGPANGGHANGTLRRVQQATLNIEFNGTWGTPAVLAGHSLDFVNTSGSAGNAWVRNAATPRRDIPQNAPQWSVYVPDRDVTFVESMASAAPRWYDHASGTPTTPWVTGTGTSRLITAAGSEPGAAIFYVPSRKLILCLDAATSGSGLRIQYMDVDPSIAQPSWVRAGVTLSASISIPDGWTTACWCSDNDRIIVGGAGGSFVSRAGTTATYACTGHYEIEIPVTLSSTWTVSAVTYPTQVVNYNVFQGYNRFDYAPAAKCIVWSNWMAAPGRPGPTVDEIYAIRPTGT